MFNLKTIALKLFRAASTHIITSVSIITVTVCIVLTMSLYIWNAKAQMEEEIHALFGEAEMLAGYNPDQRKWVTSEQLSALEEMEGVSSASAVLITNTTVEGQLDAVYTIGAENDELVKSRYHFSENLKENEAVITQKISELFDKQVGDKMDIENEVYTVKEILTPVVGASDVKSVILAHQTVQRLLALQQSEVGMYTLIDLEKNAMPQNITQQLKSLDNELRVDVVNEYDFVKMNFQALSIFMIVLSFFVLMIALVLLTSTFQLVFIKIKEQLMVLRTLGATKKQVAKIVQIQLNAILIVGLLGGLALSLAIVKLWLPRLVEWLQLPPARTDFPIGLALVITAIIFIVLYGCSKWQVRKSMNLLPLQIAQENHEVTLLFTKKKFYISAVVFICAMLFLVLGIGKENPLLILLGSLLMTSVVLYLIPFLFSLLLKFALQPARILLGKEVYLACQQLMPQVRRNMPIVLSVIGLMVILIFGTTLLKSVQENEKEYIGHIYETPVVIKNDLWDPSFTNTIVTEIESLPSVSYAYARSNHLLASLYLNDKWQDINFELVDISQLVELGEIPNISGNQSNGMIITTEFAALHGLNVGDEIRLGIWNVDYQREDEISPTEVIAIVEPKYMGSDIYFDWSAEVAKQTSNIIVTDIMVETADIEQTIEALSFLHERWPALTFSDYDSYMEENSRMYYQRWSLFVGVLVVLIVATCLGVIQTLLHVIYGKRMDYAIQRLIGLSPNGLIKLILSQVMSFVLYGLAIGIVIGTAFTKLLALVDPEGALVFDYKILLGVSGVFLLTVLITFSIQGYWISRKTLSNELVE
ncbi:MAG: ABC transporter permease [Lysinibacillus sp.]